MATNYRAREGEIDIVAEDKGTLVFVEVRTTSGAGFGIPAESVTERKRSHLVATAEQYMQVNGVPDRDWRIDVVAVQLGPGDARSAGGDRECGRAIGDGVKKYDLAARAFSLSL